MRFIKADIELPRHKTTLAELVLHGAKLVVVEGVPARKEYKGRVGVSIRQRRGAIAPGIFAARLISTAVSDVMVHNNGVCSIPVEAAKTLSI